MLRHTTAEWPRPVARSTRRAQPDCAGCASSGSAVRTDRLGGPLPLAFEAVHRGVLSPGRRCGAPPSSVTAGRRTGHAVRAGPVIRARAPHSPGPRDRRAADRFAADRRPAGPIADGGVELGGRIDTAAVAEAGSEELAGLGVARQGAVRDRDGGKNRRRWRSRRRSHAGTEGRRTAEQDRDPKRDDGGLLTIRVPTLRPRNTGPRPRQAASTLSVTQAEVRLCFAGSHERCLILKGWWAH